MNISWKTILRSLKNREMQKKLLTPLGIIIAYRFLAHIPVSLSQCWVYIRSACNPWVNYRYQPRAQEDGAQPKAR